MSAPAKPFPKYHHDRDMSFWRNRAFYLKVLRKLAMFQKPPLNVSHEHVESGYKNLTSLPLLLSFNPHPFGCFTKNLDPRMLCLRRRGFSKIAEDRAMSSSEGSILLSKTLSKDRMFQNLSLQDAMTLLWYAVDLSKSHRCTLKNRGVKDMAREGRDVLDTYRNDRNCFL